ncbi:hypothetical protein VQ03_30180 [Methylobacterium tarhaniae]|uniref:GGDEF domain-containing protein n=1 Tax=Methylobacterium tarhaniae TaxID=1187852 RepID=A0A0J6S2Z2_9HYPH|nr:hypothetical protein [Methylobacterium tarhaniae]KMO27962.1 hypothetical protein VQ03_30180 [Methylobacterium tarhaniae]
MKVPYELGPDGFGVGIGLSIGIGWAMPGMGPEALLAEADAALYRAKADGKGRYATTPEPRAAATRVGWA